MNLPWKFPSRVVPGAVFAAGLLLAIAGFAYASGAAPAPQTPASGKAEPLASSAVAPQAKPAHRPAPPPTNLKVLPKNLTGDQVMEIMHQWEGQLGAHCNSCHAQDARQPVGPNGRPRLNFADDSKPNKQTARLMYQMTQELNAKYISRVPDMEEPVSCGTCHRGHLAPESFVPAPESEHEHPHPAAAEQPEPIAPVR